jgi:TPR repeat protein
MYGEYNLGVCFENGGEGLAADPAEAARWYRKASDRGHSGATSALARLYEKGLGVEQNQAEAERLKNKAAEQREKEGKQ